MDKPRLPGVVCTCAVTFISLSVNAALISRLGGQSYYDDLLNNTWPTDANLATAETFGVADIGADGKMIQSVADVWIDAMNASNGGNGHLQHNGWRLPQNLPVNGTNYVTSSSATIAFFNGSTDTGYNISAPGTVYAGSTASVMAHLFYNTLGNIGAWDATMKHTSCFSCLANRGPFQTLVVAGVHRLICNQNLPAHQS